MTTTVRRPLMRIVALCVSASVLCLFATAYGWFTGNRFLMLVAVIVSAPTLLALTLCVVAARNRMKETT